MAKGFLDGLLHDMSIAAAVQASKDKNGKPNVYKATGLAAGMGHTSFKDLTKLGAALASQGAFDETPSESGHGSSWRRRHEDECFDYGLDPDFYDTEEELLDDLRAAKVREEYEDECYEYGLDPRDYSTVEELLEALHVARWRNKYSDECYEYDIDPEDYDEEYELADALDAAKWRRKFGDRCDAYGIDPDDYDTEEELEAALDEARWHEEYRDECKEYDLDIDDYDSEGEVVEALNTAKWRKKHEKECDKYDVDPYWYDTEEELVKAIENEKTRRLNSFRDAVDKHNERVKKLLGLNKKFVALRDEVNKMVSDLNSILDGEYEFQDEISENFGDSEQAKEAQKIIDKIEDVLVEIEGFSSCDDLTDY